jgi:hypothetical protein
MSKPSLTDYKPMKRNPRKPTERGARMLELSIEGNGLGRSIVVAADGSIIAGNQTFQTLGGVLDTDRLDVVEVETSGQTLVVVKRTDISSADSPAGRALALADNRAGEVGEYDPLVLKDYEPAILADYFFPEELEVMLEAPNIEFPEYTEAAANDVKMCTCPNCGHEFAP